MFQGNLDNCSWFPNAVTPVKANNDSDDSDIEYLKSLSFEELINLEITSVSKKSQKLSEAAAAIYVITQDDIRRSGETSIPDALRMVPGLQVARIDANKWESTTPSIINIILH